MLTWKQLNRSYNNYRPATLLQIIAIALLFGAFITYTALNIYIRHANAEAVKMTASVKSNPCNQCLKVCGK